MEKIVYIISDALNYSYLICNDAGPQYAKSMGWNSQKISELKILNIDTIYIIDNRITEFEIIQLSSLISSYPKCIFLLKVVDPYIENINHPYYHWINKVLYQDNVRLLTVYEPKEITQLFSTLSKPIIYLPYAYDQTREISLSNLSKRSKKILISGSMDTGAYPYRSSIYLKSRRSLSRFFFKVLKHPGYAELWNGHLEHHYIQDEYVKYLAKFKFMLVCGSRCKIEFLKFHECAYAGCLPIGEPPSIFPDHIKKIFKYIRPKNIMLESLNIIFNWKNDMHVKLINELRSYLQQERSVDKLNHSLRKQLFGE